MRRFCAKRSFLLDRARPVFFSARPKRKWGAHCCRQHGGIPTQSGDPLLLSDTCRAAARSLWVIFFSFRAAAISAPVFSRSMRITWNQYSKTGPSPQQTLRGAGGTEAPPRDVARTDAKPPRILQDFAATATATVNATATVTVNATVIVSAAANAAGPAAQPRGRGGRRAARIKQKRIIF